VGQQIVSYIEDTIGNLNIENAQAFITPQEDFSFVPINSYKKAIGMLCYRKLEDGTAFLYLVEYNLGKKGVSFTFPSGQMYAMKSSGASESLNPDFQFQEYHDLQDKVSTNLGVSDLSQIMLIIVCFPVYIVFMYLLMLVFVGAPGAYAFIAVMLFIPILFIATAYWYQEQNLEIISILFAVYYYSCLLLSNRL
jgi:hypothetical protein